MSPRLRTRPTLADVAKMAGVSVMTVSNVVNGRIELVREETRNRVTKAVQQLGYRPHAHARALRLSNGWAIGMLVITNRTSFVTLQWTGEVVAGLSEYLSREGYGLLLHNELPNRLNESVLLRRAQTDGMVVMASGPLEERKAILKTLCSLNQPIVALQETLLPKPNQDYTVVRQDDFGGGQLLARHLLEKGARKLVFVEPDFTWPAMAERIRGVRMVVGDVSGASVRVIKCKNEAHEHVANTILAELSMNGLPHALLCGNELIAHAALDTLESLHYQVPQDLLLTGFNAFDLWAFAKRRVTTIDFPAYELGARSGQLLLARLAEGKFQTKAETLPSELIVGDTTEIADRPR